MTLSERQSQRHQGYPTSSCRVKNPDDSAAQSEQSILSDRKRSVAVIVDGLTRALRRCVEMSEHYSQTSGDGHLAT